MGQIKHGGEILKHCIGSAVRMRSIMILWLLVRLMLLMLLPTMILTVVFPTMHIAKCGEEYYSPRGALPPIESPPPRGCPGALHLGEVPH